MRIGIAADHGGFPLKGQLIVRLKSIGHEIVDFGAHQLRPDDGYPDFVIPLGQAVAEQACTFGWERYVGRAGCVIGMKTFLGPRPR